jgi:hypothetical protein
MYPNPPPTIIDWEEGERCALYMSGRDDCRLFQDETQQPTCPQGYSTKTRSATLHLTPLPEHNGVKIVRDIDVEDSLGNWLVNKVEAIEALLVPRRQILKEYASGLFKGNFHQVFKILKRFCDAAPATREFSAKRQLQFPKGERKSYPTIGLGTYQARKGCVMRNVSCALEEERLQLHYLMGKMHHITQEYMLTEDITVVECLKSLMGYKGVKLGRRDSVMNHPSMTFALNNFVSCHIDEDFTLCILSVFCDMDLPAHDAILTNENDPVVIYFCFPTLGYSVPMRNGDILLFNPTLPHCASSRCNYNIDVITHAQYLTAKAVSGNDNDRCPELIYEEDVRKLAEKANFYIKNHLDEICGMKIEL